VLVVLSVFVRRFQAHHLRKASGDKTDKSKQVGALIAERAKKAGISTVVFDRAGNKYHGRIAAVADSARENGLEF